METTHTNLHFTAPLNAITAAVVGVIFHLSLFFPYHVLWPEGFSASFEWPAALLILAATIALFCFKHNVINVPSICAIMGLIDPIFWG